MIQIQTFVSEQGAGHLRVTVSGSESGLPATDGELRTVLEILGHIETALAQLGLAYGLVLTPELREKVELQKI